MYHLTITIFVLCTLSIGVLAQLHGAPVEIKAAMKKCVVEAGGNDLSLKRIRHQAEFTDPKLRCVSACIMKELKQMNADGTINKDIALVKVSDRIPNNDELIEAISPCYDEKGADDCETANAIHKCIMEKMPKRFLH